ncbi:GNAT family N-acetyltransferase [Gordonia sp. CPCC 206044]|uniref:GNAT family N-acetyltransferase n=1 Tax=Gordonia sp. CPCC 206044 TaxID=3140793 RepID=UPI003AF3CF78
MISYHWCDELAADDREEVRALIRRAAAYDAEAGFSAIDESTADSRSSAAEQVWHLPIRARRNLSTRVDEPMIIVAYLHLGVDPDGLGLARFVVDPDYRSRGIATLLVEELGLDVTAKDGWAGTGARVVRSWAFGTHPAAERLTARFAVPAIRRQWTLVRHLSGPWAAPIDPVSTEYTLSEPIESADSHAIVDDVLARTTMPDRHRLTLSRTTDCGFVVTATGDHGAVGFVRFDPTHHSHEELRASWIGALLVTDDASGSGLGSALLVRAMAALRESGAQLALMRIDPDDERAVRMCRLLSFEQDEAHACYQVSAADTKDNICPLLTDAAARG